VPASAVIPALRVYLKVVVVKKLVVEIRIVVYGVMNFIPIYRHCPKI